MAPEAWAVREVMVEEAGALRALRLEALRDHPEAFGADYEHSAAQPEAEWAEWIAAEQENNDKRTFVAVAEDEPAGMAGVVRGNWPKTRHGAHIWGVYVRPAWRGRGLGAALVTAAMDWARGQGVEVVRLAVVTTNAAAVRCYARCGFNVYGVEPMALKVEGAMLDELLMVKRL
jgi:RimJ/RimL family protein N-acetyltransferase